MGKKHFHIGFKYHHCRLTAQRPTLDRCYTSFCLQSLSIQRSPVSGTRIGLDSQLSSISAFSTMDLKRIQTPYRLFWDIRRSRLVDQEAEYKFESTFEPLPVIWQSPLKAIPEENRRFWQQNQWPGSWGRAPAQLGRFGRASTNAGRFHRGLGGLGAPMPIGAWGAWGRML